MKLQRFGGGYLTELELERLRKEIAEVTLRIIDLCGERFELARKIAAVKLERRIPIEDPGVEGKLRRLILDICIRKGIRREFCNRLLDLLISESKRIQEVIIAESRSKTSGGEGED